VAVVVRLCRCGYFPVNDYDPGHKFRKSERRRRKYVVFQSLFGFQHYGATKTLWFCRGGFIDPAVIGLMIDPSTRGEEDMLWRLWPVFDGCQRIV